MKETPQIDFKLPTTVKKRRKWYLATCPALDLASQGPTAEKALANLHEAVSAFVADCFERGVLDKVLKKGGFGAAESRPQHRSARKIRGKWLTLPFHLIRGQQYHREA
jgi:predicted RNase H-like HicB family nuclease